jgi:ribosomal-protein-alanine N-acetyltransferase
MESPNTQMPLVSERLTLRDYHEDDVPAVHRMMSDPETARFISWDVSSEERTREKVMEKIAETSQKPRESYSLLVFRRSDDLLVGTCALMARNPEMTGLEIGYSLARPAWGHGFATESVRAMLDFAFGPLKAHRIFGFVSPENPPSIRVLERLGFRKEGCLKKHYRNHGEWTDTLLYALLEEEWRSTEPPWGT